MYCRPNTVQRTIRYDNCSLLSNVLIIFLDNSSRVITFIINFMLKNKFITVFGRFIFFFSFCIDCGLIVKMCFGMFIAIMK